MLQQLADGKDRAVGFNQTMKAIHKGLACTVFLACDAESGLIETVREAALTRGLPVVETATMRELGRACRIQVPCAAAALLNS